MDQKNLILAIVLSVVVLVASQTVMTVLYPPPEPDPNAPASSQTSDPGAAATNNQLPQPAAETGEANLQSLPGSPAAVVGPGASRAEALKAEPRVELLSDTLRGSLSLKGGRLDDLVLNKYRETIDPDSANIEFLSPSGAPNPFYADFGWVSDNADMAVPNAEAVWQSSTGPLAPGQPLTLTWDNGQGLTFERTIDLDENYLFTVTQRVTNNSGASVNLAPYSLVSRTNTPDVLGFYILHEGLIGVLEETLIEVDYDDLQESKVEGYSSTGGWIGITDKYWLMALIPDQTQNVKARFVFTGDTNTDKYQTDILYGTQSVAAGSSVEFTTRLFAGAKVVSVMDQYEKDFNITLFDKAVDFGWFYYLTKPLFYALHWLFVQTGNFGIAILLLTVAIKIAFFPLANKSYVSMAKMRKLQPQMMELRERFGEDKQRLNQEMMGLYKKEGANPLSGCLPILVQIPVFFALYKVMFVTIEMRHAPFFGWIKDLSAQDPTSFLNGFGLLPWDVPFLGPFELFNIGVWPILMGLTMWAQQKLNPQPPDPVQAKIFLFLPIIFTFLLASFPAGLVIYWTWNNILSVLQQAIIMKRHGVPIGSGPKKD